MNRPSVVVVTRRTLRKEKYIDYVSEAHLALLIQLKLLPVMIPVVVFKESPGGRPVAEYEVGEFVASIA